MLGPTPTENSQEIVSIQPDAHGSGTVNGSAVAIAGFRRALVNEYIGQMDSAGTVRTEIEFSTDGGSTWANLLGDDAATQVRMAARAFGVDDNTVSRGLLYLGEMPDGTTHLRAVAIVGVASSDMAVSFTLLDPYQVPVQADSAENEFHAIHGVGARP